MSHRMMFKMDDYKTGMYNNSPCIQHDVNVTPFYTSPFSDMFIKGNIYDIMTYDLIDSS